MGKLIKSIVFVLFLCVFFFSNQEIQAKEPSVFVDYLPLNIENEPALKDSRVFVEFRPIFEQLDLHVEWRPSTHTVIASNNDISLQLQLGSKIALLNGNKVTLDVAPYVINGRTQVPLRFISEATGASVYWDASTWEVDIITRGFQPLIYRYEFEVIRLVNIERYKANVPPVLIDEFVSMVARVKSHDFIFNNYFSHQSPVLGSPQDLLEHYEVNWTAYGENIAAGQTTPKQVVNDWMRSPGHRENILNPAFTHLGVGYVRDLDQKSQYAHYWTQLFLRY